MILKGSLFMLWAATMDVKVNIAAHTHETSIADHNRIIDHVNTTINMIISAIAKNSKILLPAKPSLDAEVLHLEALVHRGVLT